MSKGIDQLFAAAKKSNDDALAKNPPRLTIKGGVGILVFDALSLSNHELGKRIPARYKWDGRELMFEATEQAMAYVRRTWPNFFLVRSDVGKPERKPLDIKAAGWEPRYKPFDHQKEALELSAEKEAFAYFMDMGTGKSKVLIDNAAHLYAQGKIDRVLVVAPNVVHAQWVEEALEDHWPEGLGLSSHFYRTGRVKPKWWMDWDEMGSGLKFLTINFDNMEMLKRLRNGREHWELGPLGEELADFIDGGPSLMALDESHKVKNPFSQRTRATTEIAKGAKYRRILTGSPIANGPEDYFSQMRFLDPKILGCRSFTGFKHQFCVMGGFQGKKIIGYNNTEELHARMAPYVYRVDKDDVLDLPPKLYNKIRVDLTPEQRRIYTEVKEEWRTILKDGTEVTATDAMVRLLRLQQVACGYLPTGQEEGEFEQIGHNRLEAVDSIIEQSERKVVIWARFRQDIAQIMAHLGERAVRYDGEVDEAGREMAKKAYSDPDSDIRFFVGNPQAGGTGLDGLQRVTDSVIYYSNSFNFIDRRQSEDRTHRIGTNGTVNYYDIIARRTVDLGIQSSLKRKLDISTMSLGELKSLVAG